MTPTKLFIRPERTMTWEQWQAGRAERRRLGNLVAPKVIRRKQCEGDEYLRETYGGERGPPFTSPSIVPRTRSRESVSRFFGLRSC